MSNRANAICAHMFRCALILAVVATTATPFALASKADCTRPITSADIGIEFKGEIANIVIENKARACGIVFAIPPLLSDGHGLPIASSIWIKGKNGENLSQIVPDVPVGGWYPHGDSVAKAAPRVFVAPSERHVIAVDVLALIGEVSRERRAAGLADLPWGTKVNIKLDVTLYPPPGTFEIHVSDHGPYLHDVRKISRPFPYQLPARAP